MKKLIQNGWEKRISYIDVGSQDIVCAYSVYITCMCVPVQVYNVHNMYVCMFNNRLHINDVITACHYKNLQTCIQSIEVSILICILCESGIIV